VLNLTKLNVPWEWLSISGGFDMSKTAVRLPDLGKLIDRKRSELGRVQKLYEQRLEQLRQRRDELRAKLRDVEAEITASTRDVPKPRKSSAAVIRTRTGGRRALAQAKKARPAATSHRTTRTRPTHTSSTPPGSIQNRLTNLEEVAGVVLRGTEGIYRHERDGFLTSSGAVRST
jgi:chromosome segregation ATPase